MIEYIFCSTALEANIKELQVTIPRLLHWYSPVKHYVIVPNISADIFDNFFSAYPHVQIIPEEDILSVRLFMTLSKNILGTRVDYNLFRHKWYYQQMLKILFSITYELNDSYLVIWDADTIPLGRLDFVKRGKVMLYGTPYEYCVEYYKQIRNLTGHDYKPRYSYVTQFSCLSARTQKALRAIFLDHTISERADYQVAEKILSSVCEVSVSLGNSDFSEYELIGYINQNLYTGSQKKLFFLRWGLERRLTNLQCSILSFIGYIHVTYEQPTFFDEELGWLAFGKLVYSNLQKALR